MGPGGKWPERARAACRYLTSGRVAVWQDDDAPRSAWGGRAVVTEPDTLATAVGGTCTLRWPIAGPVNMVGACRLDMVQVGGGVETYRMRGAGPLSGAG